MIEKNYAFLCDLAFFDEKKKLNAIGIFKEIHTTSLPFRYPQMFIVSNFTVDKEGKYEQMIKILEKETKIEVVGTVNSEIDVKTNEPSDLGLVGQLVGVQFEKEGNYQVQVIINKKVENTISFKIIKD